MSNRTPLDIRFWKKINKDGPIPAHRPELGNCWIWTASIDKRGYGQFGAHEWRKSPMRAHRVAWILTRGQIDPGLNLLHKCDTPACCRPSHCWPGTQKENVHDAISKNRPVITYGGERNPQAKLTEAQVLEIMAIGKNTGRSQTDIATQFGVSRRTIGFILSGQRWPHLRGVGAGPPATGNPTPIQIQLTL